VRRYRLDSFSIDDAERWGEELEALLQRFGIGVDAGSELERICLAPTEILAYRTGDDATSETTYRQFLDTSSLAEIATRLLAVQEHRSFPNLLPHLKLLNEGDPRQTGLGRPTDQASRKLFELFAAALAMDFAETVELEHPLLGSERNPDVALVYAQRRWGLACKVPTSGNLESLTQNVQAAARQVVASGVDAGFPFFNVRNVVPEYWVADPRDPNGERFILGSDPTALMEQAIRNVEDLWGRVEDHVGSDVFAQLLSPRPCVPAVLSYVHVMAPVRHASFQSATTSRFVSCYHIGRHTADDREPLANERLCTLPRMGRSGETRYRGDAGTRGISLGRPRREPGQMALHDLSLRGLPTTGDSGH